MKLLSSLDKKGKEQTIEIYVIFFNYDGLQFFVFFSNCIQYFIPLGFYDQDEIVS